MGINVWCGIFNNRIIGPNFYEGTLNGERYLNFLINILPEFLEDISLHDYLNMWWQQDGAPPHNSAEVSFYLDNEYGEKWIGNRGPVRWPARSPDLSPLDFFLWGHLKQIVYAEKPNNLEDLKNRISIACQEISPEVLISSCTTEFLKRCQLCQIESGHQFEHLL